MTALINRFAGFPVTTRSRLVVGGFVNVAGALALVALATGHALTAPASREALLASLVAGAATGLGALVLLVIRRPDGARLERFMLFAAGMMLAAAVFSLLQPAFQVASLPLAADVFAAIAGGWLAMRALDRWMPHRHPGEPTTAGAASGDAARATLRLVVVAIAVHNIPEGFAVGAGFGGGSGFGWTTAASIGLQNIPEGLVVATALWSLGLGRLAAAFGALATGLVEPFGAAVGIVASGLSAQTLPVALGLAGGAMLFVVVDELAPAALARSRGQGLRAMARTALPFVAGFAMMVGTGTLAGTAGA